MERQTICAVRRRGGQRLLLVGDAEGKRLQARFHVFLLQRESWLKPRRLPKAWTMRPANSLMAFHSGRWHFTRCAHSNTPAALQFTDIPWEAERKSYMCGTVFRGVLKARLAGSGRVRFVNITAPLPKKQKSPATWTRIKTLTPLLLSFHILLG